MIRKNMNLLAISMFVATVISLNAASVRDYEKSPIHVFVASQQFDSIPLSERTRLVEIMFDLETFRAPQAKAMDLKDEAITLCFKIDQSQLRRECCDAVHQAFQKYVQGSFKLRDK